MGVSPPDRSACSEPVGSWRAPWPNSFLSSVRGEGWGDRELGRITYLERGTTIAWIGESGASESISQERLSVWLVSFLMPSSTASLSRRQVPRLTSDNFSRCHAETERGHHDFCLSRSHYTDTDLNRRGRERGSNPRPLDQDSCALFTKLPPPPSLNHKERDPFFVFFFSVTQFYITINVIAYHKSPGPSFKKC